MTFQGSTNPVSAEGGPLPRVGIPLLARLLEPGIDIEVLRLAFDLKIGSVLVGQGEIGPLTQLRTDDTHITVWASCPQTALPFLLDPPPPQGRVGLTLVMTGLVRYRHQFQSGPAANGLEAPDTWHLHSLTSGSVHDLDVSVARSDWHEQVVAKLGLGGSLVSVLPLPLGVAGWQRVLEHLAEAERALTQLDPPAVFGHCRAALDAIPGAKKDIFDAMTPGPKRDAIDELTLRIGQYIHSGRHVVPGGMGQQEGQFPVSQPDAAFALNMMKLLVSHVYGLLSAT
jgi:hypothetical protein